MKPWGLSLLASFCWQEGLSPVVEYWYIGEQHQKEGRTRRSAPTTMAHAGHIGERAPKRRADTQVRPYHRGSGCERGTQKRTTEPDPMVHQDGHAGPPLPSWTRVAQRRETPNPGVQNAPKKGRQQKWK